MNRSDFLSKTNFINKSYKHKLRATYALLMFVILILIGIFVYFQMGITMKPIIGGMGNHVISSEIQYLGDQFDDQSKLLELLSSTEPFKNGDISVIKKEIDNQMNKHGDAIMSIKYKSITGEEYENNQHNIKVPEDYEKKLLEGNSDTFKSEAAFDKNLGEYIIFMGEKITDGHGNIQGVLSVNTSIKKVAASLDKTGIGKLSKIWIFDSFGNVIVSSNKEQMPEFDIEDFKNDINDNEMVEVRSINQKDTSNNLVCGKIPNTENLYLVTRIEEHGDLKNAMKFLLFVFLCGAGIISILIFVAANKMTNFVTKPLTRMVELIESSNGINFIEIPNDLKRSKDEIGILANTIDKMANNIRNNLQALNSEIKERKKVEEHLTVLNDELECRVKERTNDLTKVTNNLTISEDRFRIAMETSNIGVYDADFINNEFVVNSAFLKLINAPEYGKCIVEHRDWIQCDGNFEEYIYEEDVLNGKYFSTDNLPRMGEVYYTEFRLKEDPNTWLSFSGQDISEDESGKIIRFIGVLQNISEIKKSEVELKAAKEEAEEASLAKSQFLANMSHEIRTPMNAIMGLTHLINQSDLNDSQKNYISKIEGASKTLLRIINDILDFSKIEAGKLEIENIKFDLDKVFENVSTLYTASATNKGIDLNFDIGEGVPDVLKGDSLRLEQIIANLITNAIKFTTRGEVNVAVRLLEERENKVKLHFTVADTGIGLTKEQIGRLFTAFTQADNSTTRKYGGTGLGLTITKQFVELMNGEIWVESEYGEGSTFHFTIDFDKVSNIIQPSYENYPDLHGKKVLVIDHNKTSLMILERMLRSFLLDVTALRDPFEAIELLEKDTFDLLLIDFNLPEISGIDLYKRLVVNTDIKVPKTIFVSATGRESFYTQANQLGVKNFLVKPINQSLMFDAVMDALKGTTTKQVKKDSNEESHRKFQNELKDKRILLAEDNDINQLVAKDILEQAGIHVSIANNGEEAIKYAHANKFDAILMDMQMPIMDGYKATEILRETYSSSELPVIAMTANALKGDRERSIEAGMNDYISKPIDPEILFETLAKWIGGNITRNTEKPLEIISNDELETLEFNKTLIKLGNKKDFYYDLLNKYYDNYSNLVNEFSDMMKDKKYEDAKRFIHSIKGVTGNIGAMKLNKFIIKFEEEYESYDDYSLNKNLIIISDLNKELLNKITEIVSQKDLEKKEVSLTVDVYGVLTKLLEDLQKARAKEIKESMNFLVANTEDINLMSKISEIKKLVDRYRFKEGKELVEELIDSLKE
jgi:signal transduction histidine kinase/DNA-binding response OmpR family regulator/methyl-accepting chemotaxis protein